MITEFVIFSFVPDAGILDISSLDGWEILHPPGSPVLLLDMGLKLP